MLPATCSVVVERGAGAGDGGAGVLATPRHLWSQVPLTLAILLLRYILEKHCFEPLGRWLEISDWKRKPVPHNDILEVAYSNSTININVSCIAKKAEMSERQVERWWRLRRSQDKPSTLVKFTENMWKFTFYLCNFSFGLVVLWDKDWLWDIDKTKTKKQYKNGCFAASLYELRVTPQVSFESTPELSAICRAYVDTQSVSGDIWWYYMISSSFYWSLTLTQFRDVRRKDFWQMFVHHLIIIAVLSISWVAHFYRMSTVMLVLHDSSHVLLKFGKAAKCARLGGTTVIFFLYFVIWTISRLILYPYWALTITTKQAVACESPPLQALALMLWCLLLLHLNWTWMILHTLRNSVHSGQAPVDVRSSSSETAELTGQ